MQNRGLLIGVGILIAVLAAGGYFVFSKGQARNTPSSMPSPTAGQEVTSSPAGEVKEITVEAKEYSFSPASIVVNKGDKISLTFKNMGRTAHDLTLGEFGIATKTIAGGQTDTVEFTPDKSGTFTFYCSVDGHRNFGMEGKLEVK